MTDAAPVVAATGATPARTPDTQRPARAEERPTETDRGAKEGGRWRPADVATITAVVVGLLLRFVTLGQQSFSADESATVKLLEGSLAGIWDGIVDGESTPPLYYALGRAWTSIVGTGEIGLRSLSAVAGVLTVVLAVLAARRVAGRTGGAIVAWILATNPMLIWFSQEGRAYALLALGCTGVFLLTLVALEDRRGRVMGAWTIAAILALSTHYFAAFVIAPCLAWLAVVRRGDRSVFAATVGVAVTGAALAPLALAQRSTGRTDWIEGTSLHTRVLRVPQNFVTGHDAPIQAPLAALALLGLIVVVWATVRSIRSSTPDPGSARWDRILRLPGTMIVAVSLSGVVVAAPLAVAGLDVVLWRNFIGAFPLLVVGVVALATPVLQSEARVQRAFTAGGLTITAGVGLVCTAAVVADPLYQRPDWRSAASLVEASGRPDVIVLSSGSIRLPLAQYLPGLRRTPAPARAHDVVAVRLLLDIQGGQRRDRGVLRLPGFERTAVLASPQVEVARYRRATAGPVSARGLGSIAGGAGAAWVGASGQP